MENIAFEKVSLNLAPVCAFRKKDGYCCFRRKSCGCSGTCQACSDRVIPLGEVQHRKIKAWLKGLRDLSTKEERFRFSTRYATGYAIFRTCKNKQYFRTSHEALACAHSRNKRKGWKMAVYECPFCGGYHLTSQLRRNLLQVGSAFQSSDLEMQDVVGA